MFRQYLVITHFLFRQALILYKSRSSVEIYKTILHVNILVYLYTVFGLFKGPNHTYSGDGHDKLMDVMNNTFPLAVYGLQDVFSGYILYLKL